MTHCHTIDSDRCKGCGLCVSVCPKQVLEISSHINANGYYPAFQARPEACIFCAMCCLICPDTAITITRVDNESPQTDQSQDKSMEAK